MKNTLVLEDFIDLHGASIIEEIEEVYSTTCGIVNAVYYIDDMKFIFKIEDGYIDENILVEKEK